MRRFLLASGLAILGSLQPNGVFASQDLDSDTAIRDETWKGVTPNLIEHAIGEMNKEWFVLSISLGSVS